MTPAPALFGSDPRSPFRLTRSDRLCQMAGRSAGRSCPGRACRGGILLKLLFFFVVVFAATALGWMLFLPGILVAVIEKKTGFDVELVSLRANPFAGTVHLRGLTISNPPDWGAREFLQMPEFTLDAEVSSLFGDRPVINAALVDVELVSIVTQRNGKTNLQLFEERLVGEKKRAEREASTKKTEFLIRQLDLRFERLTLVTLTNGRPTTRTLALKHRQRYTNITDPKQLVTGTVPGLRAVGQVLQALLPGPLGNVLGEVTREPAEAVKAGGARAVEKLKGLIDKLEESAKP